MFININIKALYNNKFYINILKLKIYIKWNIKYYNLLIEKVKYFDYIIKKFCKKIL